MNKLLATLGIARRANKISIGETLIKEIATKKVFLVVIASDASAGSIKMITNKCKYYNVEYVIILNKSDIARSISKSLVSAVGINDRNLAIKFKMNMKEGGFIEK